nr:enhancer of polycomb-like protein 1 isoform X1 [Populus alba]
MSRLSFRPRPLDIHKKLPIVKSVKEFEEDDNNTPNSTRNSQQQQQLLLRISSSLASAPTPDIDQNDVHQHHHIIPSKKVAAEIPTPQFVVVDTYERDYGRTFAPPTSYLRARGARAELGEFVEYDLDNEDEDWLHDFYKKDRKNLSPEKFELLLFKLEVLDHKARERAGVITPTLASPIPVLLQFDAALEALQAQPQTQSTRYAVFQSVYNYWKDKRERWKKPILRRLQPPPPVNDTNPYNVFRPREKAHRLHTRRMQRRENNVQSFDKLRQVRRNLEQAKTILEALIKREEKKREAMESEVSLQRIQMKYKVCHVPYGWFFVSSFPFFLLDHLLFNISICLFGCMLCHVISVFCLQFFTSLVQHETELLEDSLAVPGFPLSSKFASSEDEFVDSDDHANSRPRSRPALQNPPVTDSNPLAAPAVTVKQEFRRRHTPLGWLNKMDPLEPVLLFTKPLVPEKLAAAGIVPPADSSMKNDTSMPPYRFHGRIGRGGRIVFDRWNPLLQTPIDLGNSFYIPPRPRPSTYN